MSKIRVIATPRALFFLGDEDKEALKPTSDEREWLEWKHVGDPVLHIELRRWADAFCIVTLDANTMAKIAHGLADNLLSCVARAWNAREKPFLVFPTMNTLMWTHPVTSPQLETLKSFGITVVPPVSKKLACGDVGPGALPPIEDVVKEIFKCVTHLLPPSHSLH
eukprot:GHVT01033183.1.p1 GENE.GHVT01033183.1~~GHVT01033183.1.p1  ORF type:complete len:165 (+),score=14.29 GHVT01033183.1:296-790(+)